MAAWGLPINFNPPYGHSIIKCKAKEDGRCPGCRDGMDCRYDSLAHCGVCGGMEGSLLPFCPGRTLTYAEDEANYRHYCESTGPFARATLETVVPAWEFAHKYYNEDVGSMPPSRSGSRKYNQAMWELYKWVVLEQASQVG